VANRNITLTLPEEDLRKARIVAAHRGTSVSGLLRDMLKELIERETAYNVARERHLAAMRQGYDLGTDGRVGHDRDELHER
jgi:hypothetical protein